MRVTNNMIMKNASGNINGTKEIVNTRNTQMTTQKKISRPSEDPVIAIRSLRLSTALSKVDQYYEKNIPDAESWLDVTETALINIRSLMQDMRTQCVNGSTDTLTQDDRNTLITQLSSLQQQVYLEGNSDYAGRTVFTGYRTNQNLVYIEDEDETAYTINQRFMAEDDVAEQRYYMGDVVVPTTVETVLSDNIADTVESTYYRIRAGYTGLDFDYTAPDPTNPDEYRKENLLSFNYTDKTGAAVDVTFAKADATDITATYTETVTRTDGSSETVTITADYKQIAASDGKGNLLIFDSQKDWDTYSKEQGADAKLVGEDDMVFIKETGELVIGSNRATELKQNKAEVDIEYTKKGFNKGELKPEYYFDCTKTADPEDESVPVTYSKFDENGEELGYDIDYMVASNQTLTVNIEASDVFSNDLLCDVTEMINIVKDAVNAHSKIDNIKSMMAEDQYASDECQERLKKWLAAAQKEADYADDHLQKTFSSQLGRMDKYLQDVNLGITRLGCTSDQLKLTKTRMCDQQETVQSLQSKNDDMDLSEIIISYTAAYSAYQASLTAAGKLGEVSLLNYI